ncbi:sigma-54-dependent Fis family transcriptional regulator [Saccharomonospora iraqiensis]|uniref:sigma-54-dependent Fis family transcriptional regulator n=1 Tax=Saccharomonospora iraqiensis TaxID=52698 RepID=UPI0003F8ECD4|nr:helix-turn-helix domain-containing protein [Saccharomonospora iraqiensis]
MHDARTAPDTTTGYDDTGGDAESLARARLRFLTDGATDPTGVRDTILTSWWRSREAHVPADRIEAPHFSDRDLDAEWVRTAQPLLGQLDDQLSGQPISLILTDPAGVVLSQHTGDSGLHRHLEKVHLAPGFSYGEQFVGTNGIGTALEDGGIRHVFGHEHYAEHLENLACVGVPIQHPVTGKTVGAVDLTCWTRDAGGLLIALARSTAEQVRQALLTTTGARELELFRSYLHTCRRTGGIVLAQGDDVVMMNHYARRLLDPADQAMLLAQARQAFHADDRVSTTLDLPSGNRVRMHCRCVPAAASGSDVGGVAHIELLDDDTADTRTTPPVPMFLPGTVGSAPLWLRCCNEVDASHRDGEWLALVGEPGVGKSLLAECVHQRRNPGRRMRTVDAADATDAGWLDAVRRELTDRETSALVIRHLDELDPDAARELATVLRGVSAREEGTVPWVAATLSPGAESRPGLSDVLGLLPATVQVPPLRYHVEDLRELVPFLLNRLSHGGGLTCSAGAMKLLMRASWPGNVTQLYGVLQYVVRHRRRTGVIQPGDLPAEYHAVARRALTQLESLERDAIVRSLHDADGNKARAAKSLGMSRATIYRKLHEYGIVTPGRAR